MMNSVGRRKTGLLTYSVIILCACTMTQVALAQHRARAAAPQLPPLITIDELNRLVGGPTLVTLHFKDATPQAVFDELARQVKAAGINLKLARPLGEQQVFEKPLVTVDIDRQPFWVAIQALSQNFTLYQPGWNDKMELTLQARTGEENEDDMAGPSVVSGPCLIIAQKIVRHLTTYLDFTRPQPTHKAESLDIRFMAFIDPKLRVIDNDDAIKLKQEQVSDENGNPLPNPRTTGYFVITRFVSSRIGQFVSIGGFQLTPFNFSAALDLPPNAGKRIASFKATLRLVVETKKEVWEVPDILKARGVTKTIAKPGGDMRYLIEEVEEVRQRGRNEVRQRDRNYKVHISVSRPAQDRLVGLPFDIRLFDSLRLLDAQGRELPRTGSSGRAINNELPGEVSFSRPQGGKVGEPVKLVWEIPTEFKSIEIPFEFKDLPLP